jgi:hypothetical protein
MKQFVYPMKQYQRTDGKTQDELSQVIVSDQLAQSLFLKSPQPSWGSSGWSVFILYLLDGPSWTDQKARPDFSLEEIIS